MREHVISYAVRYCDRMYEYLIVGDNIRLCLAHIAFTDGSYEMCVFRTNDDARVSAYRPKYLGFRFISILIHIRSIIPCFHVIR